MHTEKKKFAIEKIQILNKNPISINTMYESSNEMRQISIFEAPIQWLRIVFYSVVMFCL